jgi:hypothetical protein
VKIFSNSFVFCLFGLVCLAPSSKTGCGRSGIKGHVYLVAGNQMPSPDEPRPAPNGIKTTLYIYELTNIRQVTRTGTSAFYSTISTLPVKQVETGDDGSFKVKLKPGRYSLFVKKGELFYSNLFDGDNNIHPVTVVKGEYAKDEFKMDYNAVY